MNQDQYDLVVIGAGIVGLASSLMLRKRHPGLRICILEKEPGVARHQTGHNSGVIHRGIYYQPGSLKARLCVDGARRMIDFCEEHDIPYECCGKVVVATNEREVTALEELFRRGTANGVPGLRRIGPHELRELEPHATGIAGLHSPHTAIVDYGAVARAMADDLRRQRVDVVTDQEVVAIDDRGDLRVFTAGGELVARYLLNCAGLYSDVIARKMGVSMELQIVPFRGEYYVLRPERQFLVRGLIYPVSDPELPFLGLHFTRTVYGQVEAGPNAVLAFAREGYSRFTVQPRELVETLAYPGFRRLARRYWRTGLAELRRSLSRADFARSLQRLVPAIRPDDLVQVGSGVRAQAVAPSGALVDDFVISESPRAIHVLNAPSPAATASLAIGEHIATIATKSFQLE